MFQRTGQITDEMLFNLVGWKNTEYVLDTFQLAIMSVNIYQQGTF